MKTSDHEIVDTLLHEANGPKDSGSGDSPYNPEASAVRNEWARILESVEQVRPEATRLQDDVIAGVMANLPGAGAILSHDAYRRPAFRGAMATFTAVAASLILALTFAATRQQSAPHDPIVERVLAPRSQSFAMLEEPFVEFRAAGEELGTETQPFTSLKTGLAAVRDGGTLKIKSGTTNEVTRIDRPIRMVAVGGNVQIGKAKDL